jgi:hypothetical protein
VSDHALASGPALAVGQVWTPKDDSGARKVLSLFNDMYGFPQVEVGFGKGAKHGDGFFMDRTAFVSWIARSRATCGEAADAR